MKKTSVHQDKHVVRAARGTLRVVYSKNDVCVGVVTIIRSPSNEHVVRAARRTLNVATAKTMFAL